MPARVLALAILLATAPVLAAEQNGWETSGDFRGGWFAGETRARDGGKSDSDAFNARLRFAVENSFSNRWAFRTRAAGRFSSEQDGTRAYLRGYAGNRTGAAFGDITLDEAYFSYTAPDNGPRMRIGRFQTVFNLPGVAAKSLDRDDSPNTDVTWTDGIHLEMPLAAGWRGHAIAEHRQRQGTGLARSPLDFDDGDSRISAFLGAENRQAWGPSPSAWCR